MWTIEQPSKHQPKELFSIYSETGKRARKHHQKSRNGCNYCKQRRIKCDEKRPSCSICVRRQQPCQYSSDKILVASGSSTATMGNSLPQSPFDLACLERALTAPDGADRDLEDYMPVFHLHAQESLAHFVQCDLPWLKSSTVQRILQKDAVVTITDRPYILHSVIALSSAHLAYLNPEIRSYRLASLVHWQHALRSYSRHFPTDIKSDNSPAVYFANMIQSMLAFFYSRLPLPGESNTRPNWVVTMQGKKILLDMPHIVNRLSETLWEPLVKAHDRWQQRSSTRLAVMRERKPNPTIQALLDYCRLLPPEQAILYEERIQFLAMLEYVPSIVDAIGAFASFVAEAPTDFITMLKAGDSFALLLLFRWTQMFATIDQWWIAGPAAEERERLYAYLSQQKDEHIRTLLEILVQTWSPPAKPVENCEP